MDFRSLLLVMTAEQNVAFLSIFKRDFLFANFLLILNN